MPYRIHIDERHEYLQKWVYVYERAGEHTYLLVPDSTGYNRVEIDPMVDIRDHRATIVIDVQWEQLLIEAFSRGKPADAKLNERLDIETARVDKLLDKLMEQI